MVVHVRCQGIVAGSDALGALVSLHVQGQVVRAGETAAAHGALERFGTRVFPEMASQLVRPGEAPLASFPGAGVRLFSFSRERDTDKTPGQMRAAAGARLALA